VDNMTAPELPRVESPLRRTTEPDVPAIPAPALETKTEPEDVSALKPEVMDTAPPVPREEKVPPA